MQKFINDDLASQLKVNLCRNIDLTSYVGANRHRNMFNMSTIFRESSFNFFNSNFTKGIHIPNGPVVKWVIYNVFLPFSFFCCKKEQKNMQIHIA